jgi:hypothetical protein
VWGPATAGHGAQQAGGADQRQANQRRGIVADDGVQQGNTQPLAFGRASAVVRLLGAQVTLDLGIAQIAKAHLHGGRVDLLETAGLAHHGQGGLKDHRLPAHALQLRRGAFVRAGLAQWLAVQVGHLVGADHQRLGVARCHVACLGQGQALCQGAWRFISTRGFVHVGRHGVKRHIQAGEQFSPIA